MVLFCLAAMALKLMNFPMAPLLLGFSLGGLLEDNLRRALTIYDNSMSFMWQRPITLGINIATIFILSYSLSSRYWRQKEQKTIPRFRPEICEFRSEHGNGQVLFENAENHGRGSGMCYLALAR